MLNAWGNDDEPNEVEARIFEQVLGPLKPLLDDPAILNIDVNDDGLIWVERWNAAVAAESVRMSVVARRGLIQWLASQNSESVSRLQSRLQCEMPVYGSRVQATCPPIEDYTLCIRNHAKNVPDLAKYVEGGILSGEFERVLDRALREELSIVVGGVVNSGKTTLVNALLKRKAEFHGHFRAVVVQDRKEIRVDGFANRKFIMARVPQGRYEGGGHLVRTTYEFSDGLEDAMRSNGNFLVWGEVRDALSALGITMAQNTGGVGLMTTIHANSWDTIPSRFADLIQLGGGNPIPSVIAHVANVLVHIGLDPTTRVRRVTGMGVIEGVKGPEGYRLTPITTEADFDAYLSRRRNANAFAAA